MYINRLYEIVNKYSNTYNKTRKMKPADLHSGMYTDNGVEHNKKS